MARVVLIVDSDTGALIDVAGNSREGGRYLKFVRRILSMDRNPILNYGCNGGDTLIVSKGAGKGAEIKLLANKVIVSDNLEINGKTVEEIAAKQIDPALSRIGGTQGQISVTRTTGQDGKTRVVISLPENVVGQLEMLAEIVEAVHSGGYVTKTDLAQVIEDVVVDETSSTDEVRGALMTIVDRIRRLTEGEHE